MRGRGKGLNGPEEKRKNGRKRKKKKKKKSSLSLPSSISLQTASVRQHFVVISQVHHAHSPIYSPTALLPILVDLFTQQSSTLGFNLLAVSTDQDGLILVQGILQMAHTIETCFGNGDPLDVERWRRFPNEIFGEVGGRRTAWKRFHAGLHARMAGISSEKRTRWSIWRRTERKT